MTIPSHMRAFFITAGWLVTLLLATHSSFAQRDLFNTQVMAHGGVSYFTDDITLSDTPETYGAGLRILGRVGKSWQLGIGYFENRRWNDDDTGISLATLTVGYAWDNGYLLHERAFLTPYHMAEIGYLSVHRSGGDDRFENKRSAFALENGFKMRLGDRWSTRLGFAMYWHVDNDQFDHLFDKDYDYGYKIGISYHFGRRGSSYRGPVFNAGRSFEQKRMIMETMDEIQADPLDPLATLRDIRVDETPIIETLALPKIDTSYTQRIDTAYTTFTDTLFVVEGDTLSEIPEIPAASLDSLIGDSLDSALRDSPPVDTLFAHRSDTVFTTMIDTSYTSKTDTLYVLEGDTLNYEEVKTRLDTFRSDLAERLRERQTDTLRIIESPPPPDTVFLDRRAKSATDEESPSKSDAADSRDRMNDLLERQNDLIERQNDLIQAMLGREYPEQNITVQPAEDDRKFKPRLEVVPQVAIPLGGSGNRKTSEAKEDSLPTKRQLLDRIEQLEIEMQRMREEQSPPTPPRTYIGAYTRTESDTTATSDTLAAQPDTLSADSTKLELQPSDTSEVQELPTDTNNSHVLPPQPIGEDSLAALTPDTVALNGALEAPADTARPAANVPEPLLTAEYPVVVFFALNQTEPESKSLPDLDRVVEDLKTHPELTAILTGFTDASGNADYNLMLSEKRAESVRKYLVKGGIAADRFEIKGRGQTRATRDYEQNSRRVEITLREED